MATIELGESHGEVAVDLPPPRGRASARWWSGLAVLVLLLGTVVAAAPQPRPLPETSIAAQTGAEIVMAAGRLLVTEPAQNPVREAPGLAAYRLPEAAPLWRVSLSRPLQGPIQVLAATADIVLVAGQPLGNAPPRRETVALSAGTGAELWRLDAQFGGLTAAGDVLLTAGAPDRPDDGRVDLLRLVDARTGAERWSYRVGSGVAWTVAVREYRATGLVVRLPSGRVERRSIDTGAVVRATDLPRPGVDAPDEEWVPQVVGDLLMLSDGRGALVTYGLDRLDRRWATDQAYDPAGWLLDCGTVICAGGSPGGARALDPGTGRELWNTADWSPRWPGWLADGILLVSRDRTAPVDGAPLATLDVASGRILGRLDGWELVRPSEDDPVRLLGVRYGSDGAWLAEVDPRSGAVRIVSLLRAVSRDCQNGSDVVVCRRYDGSIGVWRLPG